MSDWLTMPNGHLNLDSWEFEPVSCMGAGYVPSATCPNFMDWLRQRQPDEFFCMQLQEIAGYCLCVDLDYRVSFLFTGPPATGKTTFVRILEMLNGNRKMNLGVFDGVSSKNELRTLEELAGLSRQVRFLAVSNNLEPIEGARMMWVGWNYPVDGEIDQEILRRLWMGGSGILNWALDGYRRLKARGHFLGTEPLTQRQP